MKITNLRRKLGAALLAGGMLTPAAAIAADLNVNLLANPGFENLDATDSFVLDWTDGSGLGYTYASGNYDNGGPLAGGGAFYFTSNAGDPTAPGIVSQLVDLTGGDSGTLIASGNAAFRVSGFFSSYLDDGDFGTVHVDLLDGSGTSLATRSVSDGDVTTWSEHFTAGAIPANAESALVSVFGTALSGGPDGYIDNVDFRVTDEVLLPDIELTVDRTDGSLVLSNQTGSAVNIAGYQITSEFEGLDPAAWASIADNYDSNSGNAFDNNNIWTELTQAGAHGDLSEADLDSGEGASLGHTESLVLGNAGAWIRNPEEDLVFQYTTGGTNGSEVKTATVTFDGGAQYESGDFDTDGDVDAADWAILRSNQHGDLSGLSLAEAYRAGDLNGDLANNHADFAAFKNLFEATNGAGSFSAMVSGVVPEPSSMLLVLASGLLAATGRTRRQS